MDNDSAAIEQGDVKEQISALDATLGGLEKAINRLSALTEPIRRPNEEKAKGTDTPEQPIVPIALALHNQVLAMGKCCDRIIEICDEISI